MPIYAYKCSACGHAQDVLQKMSDPVLTVCPECGQETYQKQVTAAGFQLKGSGWYVTDFRNNNSATGKNGKAAAPAQASSGDAAPSPGTKSAEPSASGAAANTGSGGSTSAP